MSINPFPRFETRDRVLPSGYMPFSIKDGGIVVPNPVVNAHTALKNSDIFAVVSLISSQLVSINYQMPEPFSDVFSHPNDKVNAYSFWTAVINQMLLTGNAYVSIKRKGGVPVELEQLPFESVEVILSDDSKKISYRVNYDDDRNTTDFKYTDILHFRTFISGNPMYQYIGISPLFSLVGELRAQGLSNNLLLNTIKNYIAPSITITVPEAQLNPEAKNVIRDSFQKQTAGDNQGKAVVLDQSATLGTMPTIDAKTAEYLNNIDWTRTQIAKVFGVPENYLNGQGDQQSSLEQTTTIFMSSFNRYINPFISELQLKFGITVRPNLDPIVDPTGAKYADMIIKLSTGKAPVLDSITVLSLLRQKGVI